MKGLPMKEEKKITTKELATILNVGESTVKRTVEKLRPVLGEVSLNTQGGFLFNEEQATLIKLEIQKHHNLQSRQVDNVSTEFEENMRILEVIDILQNRNKKLKMQLQETQTIVKRITDGNGCYTMNQTAKALKLPYGNIKLFEKLRNMQILNKDNSPKQDQVNTGHFKVVVKYVNEKVGNKPVTLVTGKGLVYLAKRFNTEIDESIEPDFVG